MRSSLRLPPFSWCKTWRRSPTGKRARRCRAFADLSGYAPRERFSKNARDYARWRPTYPAAAIDFILAGFTPTDITIADIGAGTGISSRLLAQRGASVIAIESNAEMLAEAQPTAGVRYQVSTAEDLPMREQSVDIVTAFQAFHWFARDQAMHEFRRILKSPGRVALIWNNRETANPFDRAYADVVQSFGEEAAIIDRGTKVAPPRETLARHGFSAIEKREFAHEQQLNFDGLIGRAGSTSYLPQEGPEYERLLNALRTLHRQFGDARGFVRFSYRAVVYRGDAR